MNAAEHVSQPAKSPRSPRPSEIRESLSKQASKAERRAAFRVALENGCNLSECARVAGVTRNTATVWASQFRAANGLRQERKTIADKTEVAERLTALMRDPEVPPPYQVQAAAQHSRLMGYDAPSRSQIEVRSVPASVEQWMQSCLTIDVTPAEEQARITGQDNPPKALTDKASE